MSTMVTLGYYFKETSINRGKYQSNVLQNQRKTEGVVLPNKINTQIPVILCSMTYSSFGFSPGAYVLL